MEALRSQCLCGVQGRWGLEVKEVLWPWSSWKRKQPWWRNDTVSRLQEAFPDPFSPSAGGLKYSLRARISHAKLSHPGSSLLGSALSSGEAWHEGKLRLRGGPCHT